MLVEQDFAQPRQIRPHWLIYQQLIRIGASFVKHGDRLATPDQLCAAPAEVPPSSEREIAGAPVERTIPTFHRMNREPVPDGNPIRAILARKRRIRARAQLVVARNAEPLLAKMVPEGFDALNASKME